MTYKQGTLLADLQKALETDGMLPFERIEGLVNQVDGLFTRIETRRLKIERQAEVINRLQTSRHDLKDRLADLGITKRSAKAKSARLKMLHMIRAIDEHRVADYVVLRAEVEEVVGYSRWLVAQQEREAAAGHGVR